MKSVASAPVWHNLLRLSAAAVITAVMLFVTDAAAGQRELAGDFLRLHILANSDSEEDQAIKLALRDAVLERYGERLAEAQSSAAARKIAAGLLPEICSFARNTLLENGVDLPITASLRSSAFPRKEYGPVSLPAGEYTALRLVIGEGEGENWWCVLFPPICLNTAAEGDIVKLLEEDGITEEEKALVTDGGATVELRFKVLDLLAEWTGRERPEGIIVGGR